MEKSFTVNILNEATSIDLVLRHYRNGETISYFGKDRLILIDGNIGRSGEFHGPVYGLLDDTGLTVSRDLNDFLMLKPKNDIIEK